MASAATPWFVWGCRARRCRLPPSRNGERVPSLRVGGVRRHHLGAAGDDEMLEARAMIEAAAKHDGGDAGAAEAVERDATDPHVVAGVERRHAPEVAALGPHLHARAEDDVVDVGGVEAVAVADGGEDGGAKALRVDGRRALPCRPCRSLSVCGRRR